MKSIIGNRYLVSSKVEFEVLETENYPADKVSKQYKLILGFDPKTLVAVGYRGINIPNITFKDGVVRLLKIRVGGEIFDRPKAISNALNIKEPMTSYKLERIA